MEIGDGKALFRINLANSKIYWLSPGESGLPTKIDLSESHNLLKHQIIWPFPSYIINAEVIENYYYKLLHLLLYLYY